MKAFGFRKLWVAAGACLAVMTGASYGRADDSPAAQALFDQGKKAAAAHDYRLACPKFEESLRLQQALGTLLNLADCYEREGKLASAWARFLELATRARTAGQTERAKIGKTRAASLAPRLSNLVISVTDAVEGLEVKHDGRTVGQAEWGVSVPADPGTHTVEASAPGRKTWNASVEVEAGAKTATVTVPVLELLPPEPKAPPPTIATNELAPVSVDRESHESGGLRAQKVLALVSAGVGVAGLVVGGVFAVQSKEKHDLAVKDCPDPQCPPTPTGVAGAGYWTDATNLGNEATIAAIVGGAGLVGGALLWFTTPQASSASGSGAGPHLVVGWGSVGVRGTW